MKVISSINEIRKEINKIRQQNKKIGFVPTMGALHAGHLSLVKESKKNADFHVMSIFVNKIQFNDSNDFENYPHELEQDLKKADQAGIDLVFLPDDSTMYSNHLTYINIENLTNNLCGAFRTGHFSGVFTVVAKLFNIVQPDIAIFGQKDIQQAISINKMVIDLNFPIQIIIAPIIREKDGLAMSSRNVHLSTQEREDSLILYNTLKTAEKFIKNNEKNCTNILKLLNEYIKEQKKNIKLEYLSFVDYETLQEIDKLANKSVLAIAAYLGKTRLIDNMIINSGDNLKCVY